MLAAEARPAWSPRRALYRRQRAASRERILAREGGPGKLIKASPIPYTILRATQFFEFVGRIADEATSGQTVHLPSVLFQPIFPDDLAANLAKIAVAKPLNGTIEVGRPRRDPV